MNANLITNALRRSSTTAFGAALLALGVAACSSTTPVRYDLAHPIEVASGAQIIELPVGADMSAFDAGKVSEIGRDFLKRGEGDITVAYPKGKKSGPVIEETVRRLVAVGVPPRKILRGPYNPKIDGDRGVVVSFYGPAAATAKCPEYVGDPNLDQSNGTYLGFGCAYQQNVAAMLENPRDAVEPRPATPPSADRRRQVLGKYIAGEKTASEAQQKTETTSD